MKDILKVTYPLIISIIIITFILLFKDYLVIKKPEGTYNLTFEVWNDETNKYEKIYSEYVEENSLISNFVPNVPDRKYYKWNQTWTPSLEETLNSDQSYKANYVPIKDTNKDGVADEEQAKIIFQVWDDKTQKYKTVYNKLVTKGTLTKDIVPNVPKRQNYKFAKTWTPKLDEKVNSNRTYKANYTPINDENKNNKPDEEETKYTVKYFIDAECTQSYKIYTNISNGSINPTVTNPTKEYYTFTGWSPNLENKVTKDMNYCATWKPNNDKNNNNVADEEEPKYIVNFYKDSKCTQIYKTISNVLVGTNISVPSNPTKSYYTFKSWSPNVETKVTKNMNYCATWKPNNDINNDNIADEEQQELLNSPKYKIKLTSKDGKNYTFVYNNVTYKAVYTKDNWKIIDSYKITNKQDMILICTALSDEHKIHGSDMTSYRTPEDMAYEWEQHNLVYNMLPADSQFKNNAKDVDLNPEDQGKSAIEIFMDRYF